MKERMDELAEALRPFAELLEDPDDYPTDQNGMVPLWVDPQDILRAQTVLRSLERR